MQDWKVDGSGHSPVKTEAEDGNEEEREGGREGGRQAMNTKH